MEFEYPALAVYRHVLSVPMWPVVTHAWLASCDDASTIWIMLTHNEGKLHFSMMLQHSLYYYSIWMSKCHTALSVFCDFDTQKLELLKWP